MEIILKIYRREERKSWKVVYDERSLENIEGRRMEYLLDFIDK